jgi:hypothetical protein
MSIPYHSKRDSHSVDCILTGAAEHPASSNVSCPEPEIPPTQAPILKQPNKPQRQRSAKCHVFGCKHNLVKAYDKVRDEIFSTH